MRAKPGTGKIAAAGATMVVLLAACGGPSTSAGPYARPSPEGGASDNQSEGGSGTGIPAPDFSFETFEGETFSLAEQRGTPVVLNFWESW
jgi:cytochrome oxidase Cu insertion factor (SCO1/SenC/PrrC family)